ncbi:allergen, putative [Talaromyces stipitatus ATCC 10500]|uniref:Allergen, putative n=1 Tax=Talaromyces stipitatus (strain ATCC 10500 / CBS 375.48 / QM 6759 / NRRL 1006) TaxID=441959 RepID=B8M5D0_TALSN|nr:allergen, putative [Talaromyces stipitatus ATCC 10500]EED19736.1 allergen, putative [Talaromyces stipitatus ATCC 10500]
MSSSPTSPILRSLATSLPVVFPSTTMPPRSGQTRRSFSSLCLVSAMMLCLLVNTSVSLFFPNLLGAFTPTCSVSHLPGYIKNLPQLKAKGVDVVAVLAFNDPFVMSAWGKANKITDDSILFLSDPDAKFSKSIGWADPASGRTGRYALVIDHGKVTYADIETERGSLKKSGAETVLASL